MKTEIKKPTKEMRDEAYRVSFFADEPLTQSILDDAQLLAAYIYRNKSKLVKEGVLQKESNAGVDLALLADGETLSLDPDIDSIDILPIGLDSLGLGE